MRPSIGVVVLNWNGYRDTLECLEALATTEPGPGRVVVVDNGSTDDSVARLRASPLLTSRFSLLTSISNLGFAGGNNLGLRTLTQDPAVTHFLLLNNDAIVAPAFFGELVRALEAAPEAGLLTGTICHWPDRDRIWYAGAKLSPLRASVRHLTAKPGDGAALRPTDFVSGCAMLISRAAVQAVGYLAEEYAPLYWEDAEYTLRVRRARLPVLYAPQARLYHRVTASASNHGVSPRFAYAYNRNRGVFVRRNLTGGVRLAALGYLAIVKSLHAAWHIVTGHPTTGWAMLSGTLRGVLGPLPVASTPGSAVEAEA